MCRGHLEEVCQPGTLPRLAAASFGTTRFNIGSSRNYGRKPNSTSPTITRVLTTDINRSTSRPDSCLAGFLSTTELPSLLAVESRSRPLHSIPPITFQFCRFVFRSDRQCSSSLVFLCCEEKRVRTAALGCVQSNAARQISCRRTFLSTLASETERPAPFGTGRPVDCLGLTKRWSLYVASTATPGTRSMAGATYAGIESKLTG